MDKISKEEINKTLIAYRRLDDYEKLFLLCHTFNPFSRILYGVILKMVIDTEGACLQKIPRANKLRLFLYKNYPKYQYSSETSELSVTGAMTEEELKRLLSIYKNQRDKDSIKRLFVKTKASASISTPKKATALKSLEAIASICDINNQTFFIEFMKYIAKHLRMPARDEIHLSPYNIISKENKFIVEITNYAKKKDLRSLFDEYQKFKDNNKLKTGKTSRPRQSSGFERQVIAYNKRIISEMKKDKTPMRPEEYNKIIPLKHGSFKDDSSIRMARKKIDGMIQAISYIMKNRSLTKNTPFSPLPAIKKRKF